MSELPRVTGQKGAEQAAREKRLAKALRDNLRRRKEQARAQAQLADAQPGDGAPRPDPEREPPA
jgi:hypothetical protein